MFSADTAVIDRRIQVVNGTAEQKASFRRVSDLRPIPFVVLLGEPGIGKSTVLDIEAAHEQASVLKVRALMTGTRPAAGATLFVDALDEYRTEGQPSDKIHGLAQAIAAVKVTRWRLSCRSEDWRKEADIAPIQQTIAGAPILVAQLLPLDDSEAAAVLVSLGEAEPHQFLAKAKTLGASGFILSPLSLKLLHKAVANGGAWPSTRYDLFASAIGRLAFERNIEHKWSRQRSSPEEIVAAAALTCLLLLVSGRRALWRSNDEPPSSTSDVRAYLTAHDLQISRDVLEAMLDTPLFRGEGEAFEPLHRTIAEYLGGQALAQAVVGAQGRAAFPLSRALALIAAPDDGPPTELRGLYAWFAAHLAKLGDAAGAVRLIEADAVTVLAYGDAAVFSTPARRSILASLDRNDPYFRASVVGDTAVGGLAGEDLAEDFAAILNGPSDGTHRLLIVFDVLASGSPVEPLRPLLRSITLDPGRPEWQRWRAADAWLNGVADPAGSRRELFDALAKEPVSAGRETLRAHLAEALPASALSLADIKSIIADYQRCPEDNTVGRLYELRRKLEAELLPELFDEPFPAWLPKDAERQHRIEITHLLDELLAASIRGTADLTAARLWRWTVNVSDDAWSNLRDKTAAAITDWLDKDSVHPVAFFDAILAEDDLTTGPWVVVNTYIKKTRRNPSLAIIENVLAKALACLTKAGAKRLLEIAVEMVRGLNVDANAYWKVYDRVARQPRCKSVLKHLTTTKIEKWRRTQNQRALKQRRDQAKQKLHNIKTLAPMLPALRCGGQPRNLEWAASLYFRPDSDEGPRGIARVVYFTDDVTADAILTGWRYLATKDLVGVDAALLGKAEAENRRYYVEWAAIAGLDGLFEEERPPDLATTPITVAIAIVKSSWVVDNEKRRARLEKWAIDRLNQDPAAGAKQLLDFWGAALDAGATQLSSIWRLSQDGARGPAVGQALGTLLDTRRNMPPQVLRTALGAVAKWRDQTLLLHLAASALADTSIVGAQRTIWQFVAFALDPIARGDQLLAEYRGKDAAMLFDEGLTANAFDMFDAKDTGTRAHREAVTVRLLGPTVSPDEGRWSGRLGSAAHLSDTVHGAIQWLAGCADPGAIAALASLVGDSDLTAWQPSLRHAQAQQARMRRDQTFMHPAPETIRAALSGGPPVNASDLQAIVMEELGRLRAELHTTNNTPWKRYWNPDSAGKVTEPLIENQCRDHLLERLNDRLQRYHIAAALPEARRGEETRVDMLVLSAIGRNLPLEAKRHYNRDLWVAASTQLQGYAADPGAEGFAIFLVFWFGVEVKPTPPRPDGGARPKSATELESMLVADLPSDLGARTNVIVFDVSNPDAQKTTKSQKH